MFLTAFIMLTSTAFFYEMIGIMRDMFPGQCNDFDDVNKCLAPANTDPILYPMMDEQGEYIVIDIDTSEFDTVDMVKKVSDIVQGQFWVEAMQMMDIFHSVDKVLVTE